MSKGDLSGLQEAEVVVASTVSFASGYDGKIAHRHERHVLVIDVVRLFVVVERNDEQKVVVDGEGDDYRLPLSVPRRIT